MNNGTGEEDSVLFTSTQDWIGCAIIILQSFLFASCAEHMALAHKLYKTKTATTNTS